MRCKGETDEQFKLLVSAILIPIFNAAKFIFLEWSFTSHVRLRS